MEISLFYFLAGIAIFGCKSLFQSASGGLRWVIFAGSGAAAMALLRLILGSPLTPILNLSVGLMTLMGAVAGTVLYGADRSGMITKPGLQYFSTTILGLVVSASFYGLTHLSAALSGMAIPSIGQGTLIPLFFILMGFLVVFGFTFPERWFQQKQAQERAEKARRDRD
jgi:hypothetical protein